MRHNRAKGVLQELFYGFCRQIVISSMLAIGGVRHFNVPPVDRLRRGVLIASNHQSFLDPMLVGMALPVCVHYLARESLFRSVLFGSLLQAVCAHPYGRGRVDRAGLKNAMDILRDGEPLLAFPEGTRSRDGKLGRFKQGVGNLAIRCGVPILPVCIAGSFESWPRWRALPRLHRIAVAFGDFIPSSGKTPRELTDETVVRIGELNQFLAGYLNTRAHSGAEAAARAGRIAGR